MWSNNIACLVICIWYFTISKHRFRFCRQDCGESEDHCTRNDFQSSQPDINSLPSHSIWSPVQSAGMIVDTDVVESTAWDNSNSASSSRSSSRLELSSIMENEKNVSTSTLQRTTSADEDNTCDVKELCDEYPASWISTRGAHSAPSSPSLVRSRDQHAKLSRPVTAQSSSFDDMSDRLWSSGTSDGPPDFDSAWNANITQAQSSSSIYSEHVTNRNTMSPKLGSFKQYRETSGANKWSDPMLDTSHHDVVRLLERLSLTKYRQTFEVNCSSFDLYLRCIQLLGTYDYINMTVNQLEMKTRSLEWFSRSFYGIVSSIIDYLTRW